MLYVKIEEGRITRYPYTYLEIRRDYPNISFPVGLSNESTGPLGIYAVEQTTQPQYNRDIEELTHKPVLTGSGWVQEWEFVNLPLAKASENMRKERNILLRETDWMALTDTTTIPQEWADYRQELRDVPTQVGFPYDIQWPVSPTQ